MTFDNDPYGIHKLNVLCFQLREEINELTYERDNYKKMAERAFNENMEADFKLHLLKQQITQLLES